MLLACTERGQYDPGEGPKGQFTGRNSHPIDAGTENYHMGAGVNKKKSESWPGDMTKCICTCQWYRYIYILIDCDTCFEHISVYKYVH